MLLNRITSKPFPFFLFSTKYKRRKNSLLVIWSNGAYNGEFSIATEWFSQQMSQTRPSIWNFFRFLQLASFCKDINQVPTQIAYYALITIPNRILHTINHLQVGPCKSSLTAIIFFICSFNNWYNLLEFMMHQSWIVCLMVTLVKLDCT